MKAQIIYSFSVIGHHLEYLHHIYEICTLKKNTNFIFLVPYSFLEYKDRFYWEKTDNITFEFISENEFIKINKKNAYLKGFYLCRILNRYFKRYSTNIAFSTGIIDLLPWAPLLLRGAYLSGILYKISFFYNPNNRFKWLSNLLINRILIKSSIFNKILLLNDRISPTILNRKNNYDRFISLSDPLPSNTITNIVDLRHSLKIPLYKKVFLHIGGLGFRKGTLDIIDSFNSISKDMIHKYCFLFVGRVSESIKKKFYEKVAYWKSKGLQIIVEDGGYCSYDRFFSMCYTSNVILIPYKNVYQSSGVLGFAAYVDRPVIGPDEGLLKDLISNYQLGISTQITPYNLAKVYEEAVEFKIDHNNSQRYLNDNSLECFKQTIANIL